MDREGLDRPGAAVPIERTRGARRLRILRQDNTWVTRHVNKTCGDYACERDAAAHKLEGAFTHMRMDGNHDPEESEEECEKRR